MADGLSVLDDWIERLETFPEVAKEAAPTVAKAIEVELNRQIAAGQDPNGVAWKKRADGAAPLVNAAESVGVAAIGTRVLIRTWGPVARHNNGRGKGGILRQVIPDKLTPRITVIVRDELLSAAKRHMVPE